MFLFPKSKFTFFFENLPFNVALREIFPSIDVSLIICPSSTSFATILPLSLKDFFSKNQPKNFTSKHGGESKEGAKFTIGTLETSSGSFRTYFFIKKEGANLIIKELRIEKE